MNFRRKNEENSYQIQIKFKKSKFLKIEVNYSLEYCSIKNLFASLYI